MKDSPQDQQHQQRPISQRPQQAKAYQFEVAEGARGSADCPNCQSPIEIGPTTTMSQCASCDSQYPVIRHGAAGSPAPDRTPDGIPQYHKEDE